MCFFVALSGCALRPILAKPTTITAGQSRFNIHGGFYTFYL